MLPTQGGWPLLAGNDEGQNSSHQDCSPAPVGPVKILRRPRPHDSNQQFRQSTGRTDDRSSSTDASRAGLNTSGRKSDQSSLPKSVSHIVNDDEWPSIADAESKILGSQKQKHGAQKSQASDQTNRPASTNGLQVPAVAQKSTVVSSIMSKSNANHGNQRFVAQVDSSDQSKTSRAPIKTYKERADEYAKARLRILGSAFSDEDKIGRDEVA